MIDRLNRNNKKSMLEHLLCCMLKIINKTIHIDGLSLQYFTLGQIVIDIINRNDEKINDRALIVLHVEKK